MHPLNWAIIIGYLVYVIWDGLRRSKNTTNIEGYFLANRSLPWWAVGSVMATQPAVTMIGTTGRAPMACASCSSTLGCRWRW
jgi:Na+/proline symporter